MEQVDLAAIISAKCGHARAWILAKAFTPTHRLQSYASRGEADWLVDISDNDGTVSLAELKHASSVTHTYTHTHTGK